MYGTVTTGISNVFIDTTVLTRSRLRYGLFPTRKKTALKQFYHFTELSGISALYQGVKDGMIV